MPKMIFDTVEQLPEEFRSVATKDDNDKYVLDLSLTSKVKEFRDNNTAYKNQIDNLNSFRETVAQVAGFEKADDFDIEKFRENLGGLRELKSQVDAGKLIADTSLDTAVEERTKEMRGGYEKQKNEMTRKIDDEKKRGDSLQTRLHSYVIESEITKAVMAGDSDIRGDALPDILNRARGTFKVDPEKLTVAPYDADGQPMYGEDPTKNMSTKEWLGAQIKDSPYLSKSSKGGDSHGGGNNGATGATANAGAVPVKDYFQQRKAELAAQNAPQGR